MKDKFSVLFLDHKKLTFFPFPTTPSLPIPLRNNLHPIRDMKSIPCPQLAIDDYLGSDGASFPKKKIRISNFTLGPHNPFWLLI